MKIHQLETIAEMQDRFEFFVASGEEVGRKAALILEDYHADRVVLEFTNEDCACEFIKKYQPKLTRLNDIYRRINNSSD